VATRFRKDLSERALEELAVEGSILSKQSDIDITLGDPLDVRTWLEAPGNEELMACGVNDMEAFEQDPGSRFNDIARQLMERYMDDIYKLTTINYDHIFATIIRHQKARAFTERAYRNRIFLSAQEILALPNHRTHSLLQKYYRNILYEDPSPQFHDFMALCLREKIIEREDDLYVKNFDLERGISDFHSVRREELSYVIANEVEPLTDVLDIIKRHARAPRREISRTIRRIMLEEDNRLFEEDFGQFAPMRAHPKSPDIARPFLLEPPRIRAGIVLVHGYLAAPEEVRRMAHYFCELGYAVYAVRIKGHGTAPEDLARTQWEEWYESLNRGYAVIKTLTDDIVVGGFSTGGCLSLLAAARKQKKIRAVFSINAPLQLRNYAVHLVPSVTAVNSFLGRFRKAGPSERFVENFPENEDVNYKRNPLAGVRELSEAMSAMERGLPDICVPTLIMQGSLDPVVDPSSGRLIFQQVGTKEKELVVLERDRHGIINGDGAEDVYDRVEYFLNWAFRRSTVERCPDYAAEQQQVA
jgi:esterase/lipase